MLVILHGYVEMKQNVNCFCLTLLKEKGWMILAVVYEMEDSENKNFD